MTIAESLLRERLVLAIDTSDTERAKEFVQLGRAAGARYVKFGLEYSSATSWQDCADIAREYELEWIADAKLDDIPRTVGRTVENLVGLTHPPVGITVHADAGIEAMRVAQTAAARTTIFGVTVLSSKTDMDVETTHHALRAEVVQRLAYHALTAGVRGVVVSPREIALIKNDPNLQSLVTLVPGTRSIDAVRDDQPNSTTPADALRAGADLIVIGREVTTAKDLRVAFEAIVHEIEAQ